MRLQKYEYSFPPELIAQKPAVPRDAARLLVFKKKEKKIFHDIFKNLAAYLPLGAVLVCNDTKVLPARLIAYKSTGGKVEILYIATVRGLLQVLADRKIAAGSRLALTSRLFFDVAKSDGRFYYLRPLFPPGRLNGILERHGIAPIPPYIRHPEASGKKLREQYQAIFAKKSGAIAAPTASLHFTKRLVTKLGHGGFPIRFITLHVGLGTFAPLTASQLAAGKLHAEQYRIDPVIARFLNEAKKQGRPIIAVGTTVVRALESAADKSGRLKKLQGTADLFIREKYRFRFVDGIITNFHVPRSSLLMLVSSFTGRKQSIALYKTAIQKKYRLFSFGDGMLLY
ncbi:MAG: tRNA preQ1(34) S-adenosylmethionine ribosyltransferase-isomerase QueA [Candidatus Komeilibacteria bacterium RIFCSPLOWO2_01_FULL_52_15]|uniref:S-adenosylmethionine:tRNA ribosyltransferase-isomerase n=2 Tax=Candidatus Komeiliibacteriota TaxID=1817908 RepID=A0A1G2BNG7_9BACT|nr:MAG: tRNA preQ1(34) S-adenosylmethionine ribosyltransferase-isomerase QueA [Candidatus Komeilibacteria bacterium RIFCSPHIGHO2_01_FULL_52_14]OGY90675.1 MAG: tRNA preQ1(34) S-adenosylmethionine ribosyltransferase-isomerase QueA [Candidatus Komeilibacteria bacterium RIFCSPLOWO2_01_FULL_52_15]